MLAGTVVGGRYTIAKLLGEGGMGSVYEARHATTGRRVAVKVISRDLAHKPEVAARFEREARAAGSVDSEHVAQVLDVDHDKELDVPFLVMEFLEGRDLDATLEQVGALPAEVVLRIGKEACLGLEKAHAQGVLHRDIKPANIFLSERDRGQLRVKLLDFGIAKLLGDTSSPASPKLTRTGMLVGSPLYMSPEQARGSKELGVPADIWSLGVVLYQALVGSPPISNTEALGELIITLCTTPPTPIRERAPWVPEAVAAIVEKALKMEPSQRYASAKEMSDALSSLPGAITSLTKEMLQPVDRGGASAPEAPALAAKGGVEATVPGAPVGVLTAVAPTDKTPMPAVSPTERTPPKIDLVVPNTERIPSPVEAAPAGPWVGPTKVSGEPEAPGGHREPIAAREATEDLAEVQIPPPPRALHSSAPPKPKSSALPLGIGAAVLVGAGVFGVVQLSKSGGSDPAVSATPSAAPAKPSAAVSAQSTQGTSATPKVASALWALEGRWKSEGGKLYDAVLVNGSLEFRIADKSQFASQGYAASEVRFVLEPVDPDAERFVLHDHLRPAMASPAFEGGVSPASCLHVAKEAAGAPLTAERIEERKIKLTVASFEPKDSQLVLVGGKLSKCHPFSADVVKRGKESVISKE